MRKIASLVMIRKAVVEKIKINGLLVSKMHILRTAKNQL